jgi:hypothetical protein
LELERSVEEPEQAEPNLKGAPTVGEQTAARPRDRPFSEDPALGSRGHTDG